MSMASKRNPRFQIFLISGKPYFGRLYFSSAVLSNSSFFFLLFYWFLGFCETFFPMYFAIAGQLLVLTTEGDLRSTHEKRILKDFRRILVKIKRFCGVNWLEVCFPNPVNLLLFSINLDYLSSAKIKFRGAGCGLSWFLCMQVLGHPSNASTNRASDNYIRYVLYSRY